MLLNEEQEKDLVNKIIAKSRALLEATGTEKLDSDTGFTHLECHLPPYLIIQHQRQKLSGGAIRSNGLDLWLIEEGNAKKVLSVNYIPFEIKYFNKSGKAIWIENLLKLEP